MEKVLQNNMHKYLFAPCPIKSSRGHRYLYWNPFGGGGPDPTGRVQTTGHHTHQYVKPVIQVIFSSSSILHSNIQIALLFLMYAVL